MVIFLQFCNIYKKTSVLVSLFNKFLVLEAWSFIKKWLGHRCLLVNIAKFKKKTESFSASYNRNRNTTISLLKLTLFLLFFLQILFTLIPAFSFFVFLSPDKLKNVSQKQELRVLLYNSCLPRYNQRR